MNQTLLLPIKFMAAEYNCAAYGAGDYNSDQNCETLVGGGLLPDTGTSVIVGITGGVLLIAVAVALFVSTKRKAAKSKR